MNSNQFEFVRQIAVTKQGQATMIFTCHTRQFVAATCCGDVLQRFVALCVSAIRLCIGQREVLAVHDFSVLSWLTYQENYQNGLMTRK